MERASCVSGTVPKRYDLVLTVPVFGQCYQFIDLISQNIRIVRKKESLHTSLVAHQAGAYPGFCSIKRLVLGVFLLPLDGMLVHRRITPKH